MDAQEPLFAKSLAEHRRFLYRCALAQVRNGDVADEVVQETLLAALEGGERFRGASSLRSWLTAILRHKVFDHYRRQARAPLPLGALSGADADGEADDDTADAFAADGDWAMPPAEWPSPERSLENARFWETLERCLAQLPPAIARAFYLREIQGLSTDEICAELGITANHCGVLLYRARMKLRQGLEEGWFAPGESTARSQEAARADKPARATVSRRLPDPMAFACS